MGFPMLVVLCLVRDGNPNHLTCGNLDIQASDYSRTLPSLLTSVADFDLLPSDAVVGIRRMPAYCY
jgi:hypothetical protein